MSITITCEFENGYKAHQAAERLRRKGYTVSANQRTAQRYPGAGTLLVAYPYGAPGGNTFGNSIMGALPPMAENGVVAGPKKPVISVLTDDTQTADARILLESLGGKIL